MFRIILFLLLLLPANVFAYECSKEMDEYSKELKIKIFCNPNEHELMSDQIKGNIPKQAEVNKFLPALKEFVFNPPRFERATFAQSTWRMPHRKSARSRSLA